MMYQHSVREPQMSWPDNSQWQSRNITENKSLKQTSSIRDLTANDCSDDGARLENMIANAPLDLTVFADGKQSRNAESPLDLSCKTRKRCADSTEERQFNLNRLVEHSAEKKLCTGLKASHIRYEPSSVRNSNEGTYIDKHYKQNQQCGYSYSNGNVVQLNRQNCIKGTQQTQQSVKQYQSTQNISGGGVPNVHQTLHSKYLPASCSSNGSKVTPNIERNVVHHRQGNVGTIHSDKMTVKQDGGLSGYQGQQQHARPHVVSQTNIIAQQQQQQSFLRTQQLYQQQQQQQRIAMQQRQSKMHQQSALMSQQRNEVKQNDLIQNNRRMATHHFYQQQRQQQLSKESSLASRTPANQCNNFIQKRQQENEEKQFQKHSVLTAQYTRRIDHSPSVAYQQTNQEQRSSAVSNMEDRKTCIQQPSQYHHHNMAYMKQRMTPDVPQNGVNSKTQQPSMPQRQESIKQMNNAQYPMSQQSATSGSYYSHPHQLYQNRYPTIQRCSPDSTNVPSHSSDVRCEKLDVSSDKHRQYSPSIRKNLSNAYPPTIEYDNRNSISTKYSVASKPLSGSEIFAQAQETSTKSSFAGSNISTNRSSSSSSTPSSSPYSPAHNKQTIFGGNIRAGSRQDSPPYLKSNSSYPVLNSSPITYQNNVQHSTSHNGAQQRSIVNGTSGIARPPSVEFISQYNTKSSNCDNSDRMSAVVQSGKTVTGPNAFIPGRRNSVHLPFSNYSRRSSSSEIKIEKENIMSHLYSQVEKEVNLHSVEKKEDVMSHLFSTVENELNAAHEKEVLIKPVTGNITDAYKNRKDALKIVNEKDIEVKNSGIIINPSSAQENVSLDEKSKDEKTSKESENFSSPLSISIPTNGSGTSDPSAQNSSTVKTEPETKQVKCLSKKQLILNAVNKDEGLKKIVASVGQKPKQQNLPPSENVNKFGPHNNHTQSPTFPESPKMPTLSPQQKLPTPVVSPLINEPPTLDPAATPGYRQRLESKMSLLRKPQFGNNEVKSNKTPTPTQSTFTNNADVSGNKQEYAIQGLNTSAFTKRPSMLQKRIPIANVAPMVHRSISDSGQQEINDLEKEDESNLKSGQILPFTTDIQTYNVSRSPVINKSQVEDTEIESHIENETFSLFCDKSDPNIRLSPLMKKKVFQRQYSSDSVHKLKQTTSKTTSLIKEHKHEVKKQFTLRQRQRQRDDRNNRNIISSRNPAKQKIVDGNPDCGIPCKKSKFSPQSKKRNSIQVEESNGIAVHAKRKAWMSLHKARHHMQLRRSNAGDITETSLKRGESLRARKRRTRLRRNALKLCKPVNAKRAKALENTQLDTLQSENQNDDNADKNRDGMWEVTGSGSTLRNGKPKGGLMLKLFFRPKKKRRFTRKQRRRPRGRINIKSTESEINISTDKLIPDRRRKGGLKSRSTKATGYVDEYALQKESFHLDTNEDSFSEFDVYDNSVPSDFLVPAEVKRLAVCKDTGETPLHRAARMGHLDVAVFCLKSGRVEVNAKDNAGYTPLHECSVSGHMGIARLLLSYGANVNCSSQDGIRPVHDAVENDHIEIVRLLMTFGADPTISTYTGRTPLKIARSRKMQLLIKGHLGDLNGFELEHEEFVWDIPSQYLAHDDKLVPETNIFSDIPPDPELEGDDDIFTESSEPMFSMLEVACSSHREKFEKCALLRDVTDYYKVNSVAIEKTSGVKSSLNISKDQLLNKSLDFMLCDRILSIPGSSCRLLKSQELMQIIQKCERRNVRKYVRKSKPFENGQNSNCSESSPVKKRKYCKKSSLDSLHVNDSRQTIEPEVITDGAHGLNSLHERETTHKTQELLSNDTFTACKKMADNNNTTDIDFMSVEEGIHLGASPTPDSDPEDEFDFSSFLNF